MKIKYTKEDEIKMIKFLCFRQEDPMHSPRRYMSQVDIAKFLGKSAAYVQKMCSGLVKGKYQEMTEPGPEPNNVTLLDK